MNDVVFVMVIFTIYNTWALVRFRRRIKKLEEMAKAKAGPVPDDGILRTTSAWHGETVQQERHDGK